MRSHFGIRGSELFQDHSLYMQDSILILKFPMDFEKLFARQQKTMLLVELRMDWLPALFRG